MMSLGNGFWVNHNYITSICSIDEAKHSIKKYKDKGWGYRVISLTGNRPAKSCIYLNNELVLLLPFAVDIIKKRKQEASEVEDLLKCGNGNWVNGNNTLLVLNAKKYASTIILNTCSSIGEIIDFTQGKKTDSLVLTKGFVCYKSPMNANTTAGHGRKLEEKKKNNIL